MRFDLVDLKLFVAVAQAGSITQGAARCALALSSASSRINAMEATLGARLLYRRARGVAVTEAGEVLLDHARLVLQRLDAMQTELAPFADKVGPRLHLLANTAGIFEHLPAALSSYLAAYCGVSLDLQERQSVQIGEALMAGEADLGVGIADALPDSLERRWFCDDVLVLAVPAGDPLSRSAAVRFADVLGRDFVGLPAGSALYDHVAAQAARLGGRLRVRMRLKSFDAICQTVSAGVGFAVVPRIAAIRAERAMPLAVVALRDRWAHRRLALCARSFSHLPVPTRQLAEHLTAWAAAMT